MTCVALVVLVLVPHIVALLVVLLAPRRLVLFCILLSPRLVCWLDIVLDLLTLSQVFSFLLVGGCFL
jgi:hypothetical protein